MSVVIAVGTCRLEAQSLPSTLSTATQQRPHLRGVAPADLDGVAAAVDAEQQATVGTALQLEDGDVVIRFGKVEISTAQQLRLVLQAVGELH